MKYARTYSLRAFDVATGKELWHWPVVLDDQKARPHTNAFITGPDEKNWLVVGVLADSTAGDWRIDVRAE